MRFRRTVAVVLAVVAAAAVGIGGGYALGRHDRPSVAQPTPPVTATSIAPLQALPNLAIAEPLPYAPDYDYPRLATGLAYVSQRVTGAGHVWQYNRPDGWKKYPAGPSDPVGTVRWRPADEEPDKDGYVMRVLPIQARDTPKDMVEHQTEKMRQYYRDVKVPNISDDTVWFAYRSNDNYRRFNYFTWVPAPGSAYADFEISVAGRNRDQAGLSDLLEKVKMGVREVR